MSKAVQGPVRQRYRPVQEVEAVGIPSRPRADDKRAFLVSPRATVFDRPMPAAPTIDPLQEIAVGDAPSAVWSADLVHCRLLNVGDTIARLPSPLRRRYVSSLGDAALSDADRPIKRPPSAAEISIADWTWTRIFERPATQRTILQAMAFGASSQDVATQLGRGGSMSVSRATVARWYMGERRSLAASWIEQRQLVDQATFERWRGLFEALQK